MSKEKLQGNEYDITVCTTSPGGGIIKIYKANYMIIDDKSPAAYVKIGGYGVALNKESVEELIEALKTTLK